MEGLGTIEVANATTSSNTTIESIMMRPGQPFDCQIAQCQPSVGGYCAFIPNSTFSWCCSANEADCWSPPQVCNSTIAGTQLRCNTTKHQSWCCDGEYEACPSTPARICAPRGFANPAHLAPGLGKASARPVSFINPTTQPVIPARDRVRGIIALAVGVVLGVSLLCAVAYALWRQRHRVTKARRAREDAGPVEVAAETGRTELPDAMRVLHELEVEQSWEMDARVLLEMDARVVLEMEAGAAKEVAISD